MKNHNRGFIVPLLIAIIAILLVGGYVYTQNQPAVPAGQEPSATQTSQAVPTAVNTNAPTASTLTISGATGPTSLQVGQQGTWAISELNQNLSATAVWGDENLVGRDTSGATQQIGKTTYFSHTYSQVGTYTPIFTLTNNSGQSAHTSIRVTVSRGSAPIISSVDPTTIDQHVEWVSGGNPNATFTIKGSGLIASSTIRFVSQNGSHKNYLVPNLSSPSKFLVSNDGTSLSFKNYSFRFCYTIDDLNCATTPVAGGGKSGDTTSNFIDWQFLPLGTYNVSVVSANGVSNTAPFTVTTGL